jgi:diguanylate cyclase (GGDEF)-like protein
LLLCDVDHFKNVNDTYGHQTGDQVLEELATRLLDAVRSHDAVGRYGGEEFLIVLSGCDAEHLKARAENVCAAVSAAPYATSHGTLHLSISVGAITIENWDRSIPIEQFLQQADIALYRAKAAGRNRVLYANAPIPV